MVRVFIADPPGYALLKRNADVLTLRYWGRERLE
jgi:hypothetical protein